MALALALVLALVLAALVLAAALMLPSAAAERFQPAGPGRFRDGGRGGGSCRARMTLPSRPPRETPAALAFDGMLLRALHGRGPPALALTQGRPAAGECAAAAPDEGQTRSFLVAAMGREALMPSVGVPVPVEVPCVVRHGCRRLGAARLLLHVEFVAIRDGDAFGAHYEAQIATAPLQLAWFRRRGEVASGDAHACPPR